MSKDDVKKKIKEILAKDKCLKNVKIKVNFKDKKG